MAPSTGWNFTMASGGGAAYSQGAVPPHSVSPVPFLFMMLKLFSFSFSSICTPHICTLSWLQLQAGPLPEALPPGDQSHSLLASFLAKAKEGVCSLLSAGQGSEVLSVGGGGWGFPKLQALLSL